MADNLRHAQYRDDGTQIDDPQKLVDDGEVSGAGVTVEDVLTSTSVTNALSAAQGKALKDTADALATTVASKAAAGAVTGSGLTMATARLLGRSTASTGAPEEISVAGSLLLSAGSLSVNYAESSGAAVSNTADSTITFAHGFGVKPKRCGAKLRCAIANNGYSVGDEMQAPGFRATTFLATVSADATNITMSWDSSTTNIFYFAPKTGGTAVLPTVGDWEIVLWGAV